MNRNYHTYFSWFHHEFFLKGGSAGWIFTYASSGYIIDKFGWQYMFYIQSIFGVMWCVTWKQLAYDDPSQHPRISSKEKAHILDGIRKAGLIDSQKVLPIPWQAILTSKAVWVNLIACIGTLWGLFSLITLSPSYLRSMHGLDLKSVSAVRKWKHKWVVPNTNSFADWYLFQYISHC